MVLGPRGPGRVGRRRFDFDGIRKLRRLLAILLALALLAGSGSASPTPAAADPIYCPRDDREDRFNANRIEGKRVKRGRRIARRHDCVVRVVRRNGKDLAGTDDLRYDRINVAVRDRRIKRVVGVF
jgi:hypothetical protein